MPEASGESRRAQLIRRVRLATLVVLFLVGVEIVSYGVRAGFGVVKLAALAGILGLGLVTAIDRKLRIAPNLLLLAVVSYGMLVGADGVLSLLQPHKLRARIDLQGLYTSDPETGYVLTPGWEGVYDDGVVHDAHIAINALGHRDDPPRGDGRGRVLLLGDSFTFGDLLDTRQTIDRRVEELSDGTVDAYNLGVGGYGAPGSLVQLRRTTLPAERAIYLFFHNDLRNDGVAADLHHGVRRGLLVPTRDPEGQRYGADEIASRLDDFLAKGSGRLWDVVRLQHLYARLRAIGTLREPSWQELGERSPGHALLGYEPGNLDIVVDAVEDMRELTGERGMEFSVLVIPAVDEAGEQRHFRLVERLIDRLRASDVVVLDPLNRFAPDDYFAHDGHLNPDGARQAARVIFEHLQPSAG